MYIHSNVSNVIYLHRFKPWRLNTLELSLCNKVVIEGF